MELPLDNGKTMRDSIVFLGLSVAVVLMINLVIITDFDSAPGAVAATQTSSRLIDKGIRELQSKNFTDAIRLFEQAATANPRNAKAFSYLGRGYDVFGNKTRAYKYYEIALDIDPNEVMALSWSGQVDVLGDNLTLADEKLARLERVCGTTCPEYQSLKRVIGNISANN